MDFLRPGTHKPSETGIFHGAYAISSLPFPVTQPTYPQNHMVVPPLNVPISMTDISLIRQHSPQTETYIIHRKLFLRLKQRKL